MNLLYCVFKPQKSPPNGGPRVVGRRGHVHEVAVEKFRQGGFPQPDNRVYAVHREEARLCEQNIILLEQT